MMISFLIILGRDRIKLERRADKHKEIERRSLRIVQVKDKPEDDNLYSQAIMLSHYRLAFSYRS